MGFVTKDKSPVAGEIRSSGNPASPSSTGRRRLAREGEEGYPESSADAQAVGGFGFTFEEQDVMPDLDPQLQHALLSARAGRIDPALVQETDDGSLRVDVTAVLNDPSQPVPGLDVAQSVGDIITGSCEVEDIEAVRQHPNVISLKGATKVEANLHFSVPEIRGSEKVLRETLPPGTKAPDGSGTIVGVVDFGCDYAHENFRNQDGTTRLLFFWDQTAPKNSMSPTGYSYGREFNSKHINDALKSADPYMFLSYDPGRESHGTHVMDTAAGNGRGTGSPGVAPKADLIFVQLAVESLRPDESFGNSRRLMEAVKYIFDKAAQLGRQAVINLSLGTHGGPHDGSTPVEKWFDELLKTPGRGIVISAGNSWLRRSHSLGQIASGQTRTLGWEKFSSDTTGNELELWYGGDSELEVTLIFPGGQRFGPMPLGAKPRIIKDASGEKAGEVIHRAKDPLNGDNVINIFLGTRVPSGVWEVELRSVGSQTANFHAWIERDDDRQNPMGGINRNQSKFVAADQDPTHTLGSISCGKNTITVGSYAATVMERDLSAFTAEGPTRDAKLKPEVSAPGQDIIAAASQSGNGAVSMSGTSMAAPHVTGLVALLMQTANKPLNIAEIRSAVIDAARKSPPVGNAWHTRYGNGRIDAAGSVLTKMPPVPDLAPLIAKVPVGGVSADTNGFWTPMGQFLNTLLERSQNSAVRIRFEIDVNPYGR
jgi:subtilisin family serine protease